MDSCDITGHLDVVKKEVRLPLPVIRIHELTAERRARRASSSSSATTRSAAREPPSSTSRGRADRPSRILHMRPRYQNTAATPDRLTFTFWTLGALVSQRTLLALTASSRPGHRHHAQRSRKVGPAPHPRIRPLTRMRQAAVRHRPRRADRRSADQAAARVHTGACRRSRRGQILRGPTRTDALTPLQRAARPGQPSAHANGRPDGLQGAPLLPPSTVRDPS